MRELIMDAVKYHQQGILKKAEQAYRNILQQAPENTHVLQALAQVCYEQGKTSESINFLRQASNLAIDNPDIIYRLATVLALNGNTEEAISHYKKVISLAPEHGQALTGMGVFTSRNFNIVQ